MDSRARIKIEFEVYGKTFNTDMSINWLATAASGGIDRRITEWFERNFEDAFLEWNLQNGEKEFERWKREEDERDRSEYERLKKKFESISQEELPKEKREISCFFCQGKGTVGGGSNNPGMIGLAICLECNGTGIRKSPQIILTSVGQDAP